MQLYCIVQLIYLRRLGGNQKFSPYILQLLAGLHQCIKTANVPRPPSRRAQKAQRVGFDFQIEQVVGNTGNRIPNTNGVDSLIGQTGVQGDED